MNLNKENKYPEIRFKGFTEAWEQRKAKELCSISTGKGNTQDKVEDGAYPFYVRSATIERSNEYLYDQEAVLTVGDGVGTGKVFHYVNGKYNLHQRVYRMYDFNTVSAKYFYYYFSKYFYRRVMAMTAKTSVDSVRMEMIADMYILFPSKEEQIKVVNFFGALDNTIALHQDKLDKLKSLKKAYLRVLFPEKEERSPKLRFANFCAPWEQRKLGKVAKVYDGTHQTPKYTNSGIMFLSVENIHNLNSKKFISKQAFEKEFKVRPEKGDILMTRIGSIGVANIVNNDTPVAYYVSLALIKSEFNPYFLKTSIHSPFVQDELWKKTLHIAFPKKINKNEITKVILKFPSLEEQFKIGKFSRNLDDIIALHQQKLDKLTLLKKSYLKKMFI